MSDERLCVICNRYFDLDSLDVKVIATSGGHGSKTTALDSKGAAHILTTKRMSAKRKTMGVVAPAVASTTEPTTTENGENDE